MSIQISLLLFEAWTNEIGCLRSMNEQNRLFTKYERTKEVVYEVWSNDIGCLRSMNERNGLFTKNDTNKIGCLRILNKRNKKIRTFPSLPLTLELFYQKPAVGSSVVLNEISLLLFNS